MHHEVHHALGVTPLVVIPGHALHEVRVEHDAGSCVEDGRARVRDKVGGHERLVAVADNALHRAGLGCGLDGRAKLLVGGALLEGAGQVHDRHVGGGYAEGHAGELAQQGGDNLERAQEKGDACKARGDNGNEKCGRGGGSDKVLSKSKLYERKESERARKLEPTRRGRGGQRTHKKSRRRSERRRCCSKVIRGAKRAGGVKKSPI